MQTKFEMLGLFESNSQQFLAEFNRRARKLSQGAEAKLHRLQLNARQIM